jgi:hypothetical protein
VISDTRSRRVPTRDPEPAIRTFVPDLAARHYLTNEVEFGARWHPWRPVELTLTYAHMDRRLEDGANPDDRATGGAIRTQLQIDH